MAPRFVALLPMIRSAPLRGGARTYRGDPDVSRRLALFPGRRRGLWSPFGPAEGSPVGPSGGGGGGTVDPVRADMIGTRSLLRPRERCYFPTHPTLGARRADRS